MLEALSALWWVIIEVIVECWGALIIYRFQPLTNLYEYTKHV